MVTALKATIAIGGLASLVWLTGCSTATAPLPQSTQTAGQASQQNAPNTASPSSNPSNPARPNPDSPNPDPTATSSPNPVRPDAANPDAASPDAAGSGADRRVESCKVTMAKVEDPNPPSNVRSQPDSKANNVVGTVKNGTFVTVEQEQDGWLRISTPLKGWISKTVTLSGCNQKTERVRFASGQTRTEIADRFIGTGSHVYRFELAQGQTLTITGRKGPLPSIAAPNGKFIANMDDDKKSWSGKLSESGEYRIILDSNFKGYQYDFEVEVQ
jgi:Bacterial SH3 domain